MSSHPNAMLVIAFTATFDRFAGVLRSLGIDPGDDDGEDSPTYDVKLGPRTLTLKWIDDGDYDDGYQLNAPQGGGFVVFDYLTYGYGEIADWDEACALKDAMEEWAKNLRERNNLLTHRFYITANYR